MTAEERRARCVCHLSPPCDYCTGPCVDCRERLDEEGRCSCDRDDDEPTEPTEVPSCS